MAILNIGQITMAILKLSLNKINFIHSSLAFSWCQRRMNYTGNPRHLRCHSRHRHSTRKDYFRGQRLPTISPLERPQIDVCRDFQQDTSVTTPLLGREVKRVSKSEFSDGSETFQAKRRRLLEQKDWLDLD